MKKFLIFLVAAFLGLFHPGALNGGDQIVGGATVLTAPQGGTGLSSYTRGDFIFATSTNQFVNLGIGSSNQVMIVNNGIPTWSSSITTTNLNVTGIANLANTTISNVTSTNATTTNLYVSGLSTLNGTSTFNNTIFANGTTGGTPTSGAGTRFMWIPSKAAFRAGAADGTDWDASNIGYASVAFGEFTKASGANTIAAPYYNICTGARATCLGSGASSAAIDSTSIGQNNIIYNTASRATVVGSANAAYGVDEVVVGRFTVSEGTGAVNIGNGGYNLGNYSTLIGLNNQFIPASKTLSLHNVFAVLGGNSVFGTSTLASHVVTVAASSTSGGVVLVKGLPSQTGDYFDVQNSDGTSLVKVSTTTFGFNSGLQVKRTYVNASTYSIALTDYYLAVSSTSMIVTTTLPTAVSACATGSNVFIVKDKNGSAGTNNITVARSGSDTIDGATTKVINSAYGSFSFTSDCSANWEVN